MTCDQALETISAALDGEASAKERAQLDAHLAHCPACAALFDELAGQSRLLRQLDCQVPDGLAEDILKHLPEQQLPAARRGRTGRWRRWGTVAACAVLVLWGAVSLPVWEGRDDGAPSTANGDIPAVQSVDAPPSAAAFSGDGAQSQDALNDAQGAPKSWDRAVGTVGEVHTLSIPWSQQLEAPAAQLIASAQALADCLSGYAAPEADQALALYPDDYFDQAVLVAVTLTAPSSSVSHTVEAVVPTEEGYEILVRRSVPDVAADDMAAWLLLVETDEPIHPEDTLTVLFDES